MPTPVRASTPSSSRRKATKKKAKKKVAKKKVAKKRSSLPTKKKTTKSAPKKGKRDPATPKAAKPKSKKLTHVSAVRCHSCHEIVYSRAEDDSMHCGCGELAVRGDPEEARIAMGRGTLLKYPLAITRAKLAKDLTEWRSQYGRVRYPRDRFAHLARGLLPISVWSRHGTFRLEFVSPRSTPERAPRTSTRLGGGTLWMDGLDIYGKVQLSLTGEPSVRPTKALVRVASQGLLVAGITGCLHDWREAYIGALLEAANANPQWHDKLPAVKDIFFPDVLALKSPTRSSMYRALMTKGRLGKFL